MPEKALRLLPAPALPLPRFSRQNEYKALLTNAREGTPLNKEAFYETDRIISDGLKKGQHLYHIMANSTRISCSKSTVYRHFHKGCYSASLLDLPRAVKFKPRRQKRADYVPSTMKLGRSYDDFLDYMERRGLEGHTELDTAKGRIGGKTPFDLFSFLYGEQAASLLGISKIPPGQVIQSPPATQRGS